MAAPNPVLPYGLRDIKLIPLGADSATPGTAVDLPVARTLSFSESEEVAELRGDDKVQASHGSGATINWELESGGLSLEAYAVMAGGAITTTGTTPNIVKTYRKLATDARPYFVIVGQAIGDTGGDLHGIIYRAKADGDLEGAMQDNEFMLSSGSGKGYPSLEASKTDRLYDFVIHETATAIVYP